MRILVVSNLYPPHHLGGYELGCRDVVEQLRARGHNVHVLTGDYHRPDVEFVTDEKIERTLQVNILGGGLRPHALTECRKLGAAMRRFSPDLVYFWNLGGLSYWLPLAVQLHRQPMAFFLSDTNFAAWNIAAGLHPYEKKLGPLGRLLSATFLMKGYSILTGKPCHFASEFLRRVADQRPVRYNSRRSLVAHWGIDLGQFPESSPRSGALRKLLYVGQIIPQKGIHTAIAALASLPNAEISLTIVGGGLCPDYEKSLSNQVRDLALSDRVHFRGRIPREMLPAVYAQHEALVFPSEWDEPFAITPLEAMASGLAVIGTTTGGSGELFRNGENAMTFRAGDPADCARAITALSNDPALFARVAETGQREVRAQFTLSKMIDRIETSLQQIVSGN